MFKNAARNATNGLLRNAGKDCIPHFLEDNRPYACSSILQTIRNVEHSLVAEAMLTSQDSSAGDSDGGAAHSREINIHRVYNAFEIEWYLYIEDLASYQYSRAQSCQGGSGVELPLRPQAKRQTSQL